jgi:hypothetical protein
MNVNPVRRRLIKTLSLFLTAFLLACVAWGVAINVTDPLEKRIFPNPIPLEWIGLGENLVIADSSPQNIELILTAPQSTWAVLLNEPQPIRAFIDLAGLSAGPYDLEVQVHVGARAVRVENYSPRTIHVNLEPKST